MNLNIYEGSNEMRTLDVCACQLGVTAARVKLK
ncbi:MAG: hypothetical protein QT03_C0001G0838 [archaeon GW2011_AR10]|nr:MAG: hypothetical protein QT03_C0001G0838 [archaeon GW2011_AR10]